MELAEHIQIKRELGNSICARLSNEIDRLGFAAGSVAQYPAFDAARFELVKDPYTGEHNLAGYWHDPRQRRIGSLQFNSDGTFYAEYDVVRPHPTKPKWFVEGIAAWGTPERITAEAKLLLMPE
jgi:hypothetical protein